MPARPVLLDKFSKNTTAVFISTHCKFPVAQNTSYNIVQVV